MSEEKMPTSPFECPAWFDGKKINETVFCEEFLRDYCSRPNHTEQ